MQLERSSLCFEQGEELIPIFIHINPTPIVHPISLASILTLRHPRTDLGNGLIPSGFPINPAT